MDPDKNVAAVKGRIGNDDLNLESVSGRGYSGEFGNLTPPPPLPLRYPVGPRGDAHTEQKICEFLYAKYKDTPDITGTIEVISKEPICSSCTTILDLFQIDFKGIKVIRVEIIL